MATIQQHQGVFPSDLIVANIHIFRVPMWSRIQEWYSQDQEKTDSKEKQHCQYSIRICFL